MKFNKKIALEIINTLNLEEDYLLIWSKYNRIPDFFLPIFVPETQETQKLRSILKTSNILRKNKFHSFENQRVFNITNSNRKFYLYEVINFKKELEDLIKLCDGFIKNKSIHFLEKMHNDSRIKITALIGKKYFNKVRYNYSWDEQSLEEVLSLIRGFRQKILYY